MSSSSSSPAGSGTSRNRRLPTMVAALLALLLVVALLAALLLWREVRDLRPDAELQRAETSATDAASRIAVSMTSYDYKTVDQDFSWIQDDGTSSFTETFLKSSEPIRKLIQSTKAHAEGTVTDAAGKAEDPDHVTVVLFVDQQLTRAGDAKPSVDSSRVAMDMVRDGTRWLVDEVTLR